MDIDGLQLPQSGIGLSSRHVDPPDKLVYPQLLTARLVWQERAD
jgi:hypothetical protein